MIDNVSQNPNHKPKQNKESKIKSNPECAFSFPRQIIDLYFANELDWRILPVTGQSETHLSAVIKYRYELWERLSPEGMPGC